MAITYATYNNVSLDSIIGYHVESPVQEVRLYNARIIVDASKNFPNLNWHDHVYLNDFAEGYDDGSYGITYFAEDDDGFMRDIRTHIAQCNSVEHRRQTALHEAAHAYLIGSQRCGNYTVEENEGLADLVSLIIEANHTSKVTDEFLAGILAHSQFSEVTFGLFVEAVLIAKLMYGVGCDKYNNYKFERIAYTYVCGYKNLFGWDIGDDDMDMYLRESYEYWNE